MIYWAAVFFAMAIVAAVFGFGGIVTGAAAGVAKIVCIVFLGLAALALVFHRRVPT
jgi:uncharacterized membrane protein YtjA (UPF0391 family)